MPIGFEKYLIEKQDIFRSHPGRAGLISPDIQDQLK